ncbi:unnamed protein product [Linum tenue]|uniref:Uncharacterized protein n=1 Tax=Linum tenue TaxID=586396 RepID=A0AAV0KZG5_9ROSI|nr:unnamed protein product [Linum tenue]CAI0426404.1 unnamed protein product [Linum tenue]CAI0426405.1 unnamed protein product [Linum tenue]
MGATSEAEVQSDLGQGGELWFAFLLYKVLLGTDLPTSAAGIGNPDVDFVLGTEKKLLEVNVMLYSDEPRPGVTLL